MCISGNVRPGDARQSAAAGRDACRWVGKQEVSGGTDAAETPETLQLLVWYPGVMASGEEQAVVTRVA